MTAHRTLSWLAALSLLMAGFIVAQVGYYEYLAPSPLSYPALPFPAEKSTVMAGETIPFTVSRCNGTDALTR